MSIQTDTHSIAFTSTRFTKALERRVLHHIHKHNIIAAGERLVVAVSGGPDSTALLVILSSLSFKLRLDITVAHFNHLLRTHAEATADLDFVRSLAAALDLPLVQSSGDVRAYARDHRLSIEDAARRLRYAFLSEQAAATCSSVVAVGHTLDDQAETVLLHLIRGAGLDGLAGMRPRSSWPLGAGSDLARPLLCLSRQETARYCAENGIEPRQDPTNDLPTATRNQVRHEVLPVLRRLNPRIDEALARFAESVGSDARYLDELAASAFDHLAVSDDSSVSLNRSDLRELPRPISARVIRLAFAEVHKTDADLEASHIEALLEALHGPPGSHSLAAGITATIDQRSFILSEGRPASSTRITETPLTIPGHTTGGSWLIAASLERPSTRTGYPGRFEAYLDADKAGTDLTVRSRRPGDRLRPLGLGGEKKLQDILVDAKVPAQERDGIPLVCAGEQIGWVVGHCIDERLALDIESRQALHLVASRTTDT